MPILAAGREAVAVVRAHVIFGARPSERRVLGREQSTRAPARAPKNSRANGAAPCRTRPLPLLRRARRQACSRRQNALLRRSVSCSIFQDSSQCSQGNAQASEAPCPALRACLVHRLCICCSVCVQCSSSICFQMSLRIIKGRQAQYRQQTLPMYKHAILLRKSCVPLIRLR